MKQFFTENNDRLSMKRLCGFACTIALCIKVVHAPTDALIYTVGGIAAAALGFTTAEKIFKKNETI
jgi:hypothetical protein